MSARKYVFGCFGNFCLVKVVFDGILKVSLRVAYFPREVVHGLTHRRGAATRAHVPKGNRHVVPRTQHAPLRRRHVSLLKRAACTALRGHVSLHEEAARTAIGNTCCLR